MHYNQNSYRWEYRALSSDYPLALDIQVEFLPC